MTDAEAGGRGSWAHALWAPGRLLINVRLAIAADRGAVTVMAA